MINVDYQNCLPSKEYVMHVGGSRYSVVSSEVPDSYVHAYDADYGYDYVLCGNKYGSKILPNPSNNDNELIFVIPYDVAEKFVDILNSKNHMGMDWVIEKY